MLEHKVVLEKVILKGSVVAKGFSREITNGMGLIKTLFFHQFEVVLWLKYIEKEVRVFLVSS